MASAVVVGHGLSPQGKGWGPRIDAMPTVSGVYCIETRKGELYVGSSKNVKGRLRSHFHALDKGSHCNRKLQRSYGKYGLTKVAVLLICRVEDLLLYEQLALDALSPTLNLTSIAGKVEWTSGRLRRMRAKKMGNPSRTGMPHTPETKAKMSEARKRAWEQGRHVSRKGMTTPAETTAKMSEARKRAWEQGLYQGVKFR